MSKEKIQELERAELEAGRVMRKSLKDASGDYRVRCCFKYDVACVATDAARSPLPTPQELVGRAPIKGGRHLTPFQMASAGAYWLRWVGAKYFDFHRNESGDIRAHLRKLADELESR